MSNNNPKDILNRWRFRRDVERIKDHNFTIVSSNCIGGRIYEILGIPYLTPTVGLFFYPECYIKLLMNIDYYFGVSPKLASNSRYIENANYPVATLDDIEIHFLHSKDPADAIGKWQRRTDRVNLSNIFITMTDRDGFVDKDALLFDKVPFENKVLFSARKRPIESSVVVPEYERNDCVGDIYKNYQNIFGVFSFSDWINKSSK